MPEILDEADGSQDALIAKVEKQQKESKINPVCDIAEKANKRFNFF